MLEDRMTVAAERVRLERQHDLLVAIEREVDGPLRSRIPVADEGWSGPANGAYRRALEALRDEVEAAASAVRSARRLTGIAAEALARDG
jgi:hypothetical protein